MGAQHVSRGCTEQSVNVDWGSVPDWLAGIGALSALFFAAVAARAAWDGSKLQARQILKLEEADLRRVEAGEREQASKVAVWIRMAEDAAPVVVCMNGRVFLSTDSR